MPEGDTIHRLATRLRPQLEGQVIERLYLRDLGERPGARGKAVTGVAAQGKNLLIEIDGATIVRVHLGMKGRWRRYDEHRTRRSAKLVLATAEHDHVCAMAMRAELFPKRERPLHRALSALGPDLCAERVDLDLIMERARARGLDRPLGDVLLDQCVGAGVGNVYKSELCFLMGTPPEARADTLSRDALRAGFGLAHTLLRRNLDDARTGGTRTTVFRDLGPPRRMPLPTPLWVYGRGRQPCLACGTTIAVARLGEMARITYHCPSCQRPAAPGPQQPQ